MARGHRTGKGAGDRAHLGPRVHGQRHAGAARACGGASRRHRAAGAHRGAAGSAAHPVERVPRARPLPRGALAHRRHGRAAGGRGTGGPRLPHPGARGGGPRHRRRRPGQPDPHRADRARRGGDRVGVLGRDDRAVLALRRAPPVRPAPALLRAPATAGPELFRVAPVRHDHDAHDHGHRHVVQLPADRPCPGDRRSRLARRRHRHAGGHRRRARPGRLRRRAGHCGGNRRISALLQALLRRSPRADLRGQRRVRRAHRRHPRHPDPPRARPL